MSINIDNYKQTANKFITGITVVTGNYNNLFGITINSFSSLSLHPILVSFNVGDKSRSLELLLKSDYFNINILSNKQKDLALSFAADNKFDHIDYSLSENNIPILKKNLALLECKSKQVMQVGDHHIFVGEVVNSVYDLQKKPLIYYNSEIIDKIE